MIMDSDTTASLSLSCPQSEIMKKEVFLFEYLHNRSCASKALGFMKCVVLLRPEQVCRLVALPPPLNQQIVSIRLSLH